MNGNCPFLEWNLNLWSTFYLSFVGRFVVVNEEETEKREMKDKNYAGDDFIVLQYTILCTKTYEGVSGKKSKEKFLYCNV